MSTYVDEQTDKAKELMNRVGGKIFAFPVNEEDPLSRYVVTMCSGDKWLTYPHSLDISEAAAGIKVLLEVLEKNGQDADYEKNVRFVSYQAQIDAPSVTMRRLKKETRTSGYGYVTGVDVIPKDDEEGEYHISARGLIKFSYYSMIDEKLPKAIQFMYSYYQLLTARKYGKPAAAIKEEVMKMDKNQATKWIEQTYARYITDDMEVMDLMSCLK